MTVERETTRGRFLCICPPKELHGGIRRGHEEQVRAQIADNGFGVDSQIFLGDGGGLAISEGPEMFNDGKVVVAFCGELTNKEQLLQQLQKLDGEMVEDEMSKSNMSARLIGKLFEQFGDHPHGIVGKLRGIYTFVVFDVERVRMFAARDSSGPIPLYQSRLSNGTMMLSNYVTRECDELSEVSAGHYVYGARRCAFPLKFSEPKVELDKAHDDAKSAVSKALQGILTRSELQPRLHLRKPIIQRRLSMDRQRSPEKRPPSRKSKERQRSPKERTPIAVAVAPPVVILTVLSQTIHSDNQQCKKSHLSKPSSGRCDSSSWWRKPEPKPLSAAAQPFVMPAADSAEKETSSPAPAEKNVPAAGSAAPRPQPSDQNENQSQNPQNDQKELIIEAVNQLHRIASSGKIQCLLKVQEQELSSPRGGMRRTPSCGEMDKMTTLKSGGGMQRVNSLREIHQ